MSANDPNLWVKNAAIALNVSEQKLWRAIRKARASLQRARRAPRQEGVDPVVAATGAVALLSTRGLFRRDSSVSVASTLIVDLPSSQSLSQIASQ